MLRKLIWKRKYERGMQLKRAIIATFAQPVEEVFRLLDGHDERDWQAVMWWLDVSGLALYLLERVRTAHAEAVVPPSVLTSLEDRLGHNTDRTWSLLREAAILCKWLQEAEVPYALLKGVTLVPDSVPNPALRSQTDLDFLVARQSIPIARHFISRLGYHLHANTGSTLEFRAGICGRPDVMKIYSVHSQRALELHVAEGALDTLARRQVREIEGVPIASLSPADILVQQAAHVLKHLCGEHTRIAWILEFRNHVQARQADLAFWREVEGNAAKAPNGNVAMGVALWLSSRFFGPIQANLTERWSEQNLPQRVRLWLVRFADRVLLSDSVGNKYYGLLRNQLAVASHEISMRTILFPSCLPALITKPQANESLRSRARRYTIEASYFWRRLRFHLIEGIVFGIEFVRWRRAVATLPDQRPEKSGAARAIRRAGSLSLLAFAGLSIVGSQIHAQSVPGSGPPAPATKESSLPSDANAEGIREDKVGIAVMPATDLIELLQNDPAVMVECKGVVADFLQQQGASVAPDAITDEQVYNAIETRAELRGILTRSLLSRGYITEEQVQDASTRARNNLVESLRQGDPGTAMEAESIMQSPVVGVTPRQTLGRQEFSDEVQTTEPRNSTPPRNVTDGPEVLHRPTPYNLRSLRDLYQQVPDSPEKLERFGSDVFISRGTHRSGGLSSDDGGSRLDIPVGPDYVLGPGDQLSISMWGGVSQNLLRVVNREGGVALLEAGLVQVAGLSMERAQSVIEEALRTQYRDAHVAVTVARIRTIRIFVVGDVQRPGSYEISSMASVVSALYAAGGPTAVGSLRVLRHYRDKKMIGEVDLYDFMLHGVRAETERLQSGDTLLIPPAGPQVAVFGAVRRPAIYELRSERSLADVLEEAGGLTAAAAPGQITVARVLPGLGRQVLGLNAGSHDTPPLTQAELGRFEIKDGDRVHVPTVLPVNERVVYVQGHVARPGRIAFRDNMRLSDVLTSYADMLPEPADNGELVRLVAPDLHPETIEFSIADALIGNSTLTLQPFDTVRVFGRYEHDAPLVSVRGEVQRPGDYPMFEGMTAAQLVRAAGGFKRDALLSRADLTSYQVMNGSRISVSRRDVPIGSVVIQDDRAADIRLKSGDVLTVHQISGWNDIGASITIDGEVGHPGDYGFQEGEHLSDVLRRADGFRDTAYPEGAVLTRPEVAALEEKSRQELIRQIETSSAAARLSARGLTTDQGATLQSIQQQQDQVLAQLKSRPSAGRLVIHIAQDIDSWAGTAADIEVRRGDVLKIPKRPGFVLVSGQVYNTSAITYTPHQTAEWYLKKAGGATQIADRKHIFIVRVNGEVIGRNSSSWSEHDVVSTRLEAGDTVVVPQKIQGPSIWWRNLLATAQVAASITIAASVAGL
ncbi:MAG TPA: SLBB domain-containing protein [Terracidiphilus sp.]